MKIYFKFILIVFFIFVVTLNLNIVQAVDGSGLLQRMQGDIENFKAQGGDAPDVSNAVDDFGSLAQILVGVGAAIMVAVTTYMGIKYLISGPEAQAKLKTQLIGLVVSGIVIFGSYSIWKMVVLFAKEL